MWFHAKVVILNFLTTSFLQTSGANTGTVNMFRFTDHEDYMKNSSCEDYMEVNNDPYFCNATDIGGCFLHGISMMKNQLIDDMESIIFLYNNSQSIGVFKVYKDNYLGSNYVAMTYFRENAVGQILIKATSEGSTTVDIQLPYLLNFTAPQCNVTYKESSYSNGQTIKININHGENVTINGQCDLTGTRLNGSKRIAVFSGSYTEEKSGLFFEQLMPFRTFGKYFVIHPASGVDCENIISVVTRCKKTTLKISGYDYIVIPREMQQVRRKFGNNENIYIESTKPVSVMQYITCREDNAMILVSPTEEVLESNLSLSDTILSNVPDSNFFTSECFHPPFIVTYITDINRLVYSQYIVVQYENKIGGSILRWEITTGNGYGTSYCRESGIKEVECVYSVEGHNCGKQGTNRDLKGNFFVISSPANRTDVITSGCNASNIEERHDFVIKITDETECSVYLITNIDVNGTNVHLKYLALPVDVLGLEYYVFTKCSLYSFYSMCNVTAVYNDTTVEIEGLGKQILKSAYDGWYFSDNDDLSGKFVRANKRVSVVCTCIENSIDKALTINTMQLPPVNTWGKQFRFTFLQVDVIDKGQIFCTASTGNTVVVVKIYQTSMIDTNSTYVYNKDISLNSAGEIESLDFEKNASYDIVAYKPIMVTLVFKHDNNVSTVFVPPIEQATNVFSLNDGSRVPVFTEDINGSAFRRPFEIFDNYLYIATNFKTINKPFEITEQKPGDNEDNDRDGLVDEDYCLFLLGDYGYMDLDLDGAYNEDCHGCNAGYELNTDFLTCEECQTGFYRNGSSKIDKCHPCPFNHTTFDRGSISIESCVPHCAEGNELDDNDTCVPCEVGYYKNISSRDTTASTSSRWKCRRCPDGYTTLSNNATSCIVTCLEGQEYNVMGETCENCQIGYYKNTSSDDIVLDVNQRLNCKKCEGLMTTMKEGSKNGSDCIDVCHPGYELHKRTCRPCQVGYFKNVSSDDLAVDPSTRWTCRKCGRKKTTYSTGSNSSEDCIELCKAGFEFNTTTKMCQPCQLGFYKKVIGSSENCAKCRQNYTTKVVGQTICVPSQCMCPCSKVHPVVNYTSSELAKVIEQLQKELKVNRAKLSSARRRKTSVRDDRLSSKTFGVFGIMIIVSVLLVFLIFDFVLIKHHIQTFMGNVREICP